MSLGLETNDKVVGVKQVRRAINSQEAKIVYIAKDADKKIISDIEKIAKEKRVQVIRVLSMKELGKACGIEVSAAVAAII